MQVTFKCKRSGNTVSFSREADISSMRKDTGYEEITTQTTQVVAPANIEQKRRGRPKTKQE